MERGNSTESPPTLAFGDRIRAATRELPSASDQERSAYGRAATQSRMLASRRQELLFFAKPAIPPAPWSWSTSAHSSSLSSVRNDFSDLIRPQLEFPVEAGAPLSRRLALDRGLLDAQPIRGTVAPAP